MAEHGWDDDYGQMTVGYVKDWLTDFDCTIVSDETEEDALNKLNALSTLHSVRNSDLLDGLIAFLKNNKKTMVTSSVLDEYESQILAKAKKPSSSKTTSEAALRNDRQILKELSLSMLSKTSLDDEEDDDGACVADDLDLTNCHFDEKRNRNAKNIQMNDLGFTSKSKFTGASFVARQDDENATAYFPMVLPRQKIISDCRPSAYQYGHSSIVFDIYEIMPWLADDDAGLDDGNDENNMLTLTGSIFPSEGIHLAFDNATLFTAKNSYLLDFDGIERISLFPGKQLTVRCICDSNRVCRVQSVEELPPIPMAQLGHLSHYSHLKLFIASGPFCFGDGVEKFNQMVASAKSTGANALLLIGPFVPSSLDTEEPEEFFKKLLATAIQAEKGARMRVYIVPNCQSDLMAMPYFPTPPLVIPGNNERTAEHVTFLPDPAIFELEGVRFAVSSSEVLMHLCKREIYKSVNSENEDRMQRLCSNLFSSRSLYPLFPSDPSLSVSLQNSLAKIKLDAKPHVLILPSILQPTTKEVDGCLLINPGRFMRGKGSNGTFVLLEIDLQSALSSSASIAAGTGTAISQFTQVSLLAS